MRSGSNMASNVYALLFISLVGCTTAARIKQRINGVEFASVNRGKNPEAGGQEYRNLSSDLAQRRVLHSRSSKIASRAPDKRPVVQEKAPLKSVQPDSLIQKAAHGLSAVLSAVPVDSLLKTKTHESLGTMPRTLLITGIVVGLVLVLACTWVLLSCCMTPGKKKDKKLASNDSLISCDPPAGPRKQHTFEGRVVYEWDQTLTMASLYISVPEGLTKNDLDIQITSRCLQVGRKGKPPFMREDTYEAINEEHSGWRLRSNGELQIHLQKERKGEWPCVLLVANQENDA